MRRFKPKPGRRSRAAGRIWGAVFVIWGILVLFYLVWLGTSHAEAVSATLNGAVTRTPIPLSGSYGGTWQGKPVYIIHNSGGNLQNVSVYNWAEDALPALYIGPPGTFGLTGDSPNMFLSAPYNLPSGTDIWVVAASKPPTEFKVTWDSPQGVLFTTLSVDEVKGSTAALAATEYPPFLVPAGIFGIWQPTSHDVN